MIILTTSAASQSISVIPRSYLTTFDLLIRDDSTNVEVTYNITNAINQGNYLNFSNTFSPVLVENHFYTIKLIGLLDTPIFEDKVFCTDQYISQRTNEYYNLNENEYLSYNDYDNTYKVR